VAGCIAAVAVHRLSRQVVNPVVAFLESLNQFVAAGRFFAFLAWIGTVIALLQLAVSVTTVEGGRVSVVALLGAGHLAVAAFSLYAGVSGDGTLETNLDGAVAVAAVTVVVVAVVTGFAAFDDGVAADDAVAVPPARADPTGLDAADETAAIARGQVAIVAGFATCRSPVTTGCGNALRVGADIALFDQAVCCASIIIGCVAVVALLHLVLRAIAAELAREVRSRADPGRYDAALVITTLGGIGGSQQVTFVTFLAELNLAVAALHTGKARIEAVVVILHEAAVVGTTIVAVSVAVIAGFITFQEAVATVRASNEEAVNIVLALPTRLHLLAVTAASVTTHGHAVQVVNAVVADFRIIEYAVAAHKACCPIGCAVVVIFNGEAVGAAAVAAHGLAAAGIDAIVTSLDGLGDAIAALTAAKTWHGTIEVWVLATGGVAAVIVLEVAIVALFHCEDIVRRVGRSLIIDMGYFNHSVAADRAGHPGLKARGARLQLALGAAPVTITEVAVVAGFLTADQAVAAKGTAPALGRAGPAGFDGLTAVHAAIARLGIAVVAGLVAFHDAIAAFHTGFPWFWTRVVEIQGAAVIGTTHAVRIQAFVAPFIGGDDSVAAELTGRARQGTDPSPSFDLAAGVAAVATVVVAVVALFRTLDDGVATFLTGFSWGDAVEAAFWLAIVIAAVAGHKVSIVTTFAIVDEAIAAGRTSRRRTAISAASAVSVATAAIAGVAALFVRTNRQRKQPEKTQQNPPSTAVLPRSSVAHVTPFLWFSP
jgi:hypothetical protein